MLGPVLAALTFQCNNTTYRPVMNAIDLLARYVEADAEAEKNSPKKAKVGAYAPGEQVPIEGVVPKEWRDAITDEQGRIERIPYGSWRLLSPGAIWLRVCE
ncbi:MAG: hypothetical protein ACRDQ4_23305 [Pseudonocardiaceae bacterium]